VAPERRPWVILREVLIAFVLLLTFMFVGEGFLRMMNLSELSLQIGGGVILFLIALRMIFPPPSADAPEAAGEPLIVPLAIPAIAGPSALATVLLLVSQAPDHVPLAIPSPARSPLSAIYSLIDLREILLGCNRRYLEYLSALDDFSAGDRNLHRLQPQNGQRPYPQGLQLLRPLSKPWRTEWIGALSITMAVSAIILVLAERIQRIAGDRFVVALERLMGLVLVAMSIEMMLRGIKTFVMQLTHP
jgi:small neutral amino acid transporter SnatA (MarC family)